MQNRKTELRLCLYTPFRLMAKLTLFGQDSMNLDIPKCSFFQTSPG